ncbi:MAG: hypothetical protein Q8O59_03240 [bacterium]|nr:hypothetical protein [bacterium]
MVYQDVSGQLAENIQSVFGIESPDNRIISNEAVMGGVSGAIISFLQLEKEFSSALPYKRVVCKFAEDVGKRERKGAGVLNQLLTNGVTVIPFAAIKNPHLHVMRYVPGETLNSLVVSNHDRGQEQLVKVAVANRDLWLSTKTADRSVVTGPNYLSKLSETIEMMLKSKITAQDEEVSLGDLQDSPLFLNGRSLPSLRVLLQEMADEIESSDLFGIQHGDEGAGNFIYYEDTIFVVDNEKAGYKPIGEGLAKLFCWFPATLSYPGVGSRVTVVGGALRIDGKPGIPSHAYRMNKRLVGLLKESDLPDLISGTRLRAFCACYYIRELQWLTRRQREHMKFNMIEMALHQLMRMHEKAGW